MKVTVVGANGQIGKQLVRLLKESGHTPIAMVRKQEQVDEFSKEGIESVLADLEGPVSDLVEAFKGSEAIVFTAGSGGSTGLDKTLLIDLDGAVKTIEAAEHIGVKRYVMVSALQANNREKWNKDIRPYYVAKHYADEMLIASDLDYTIVRPGGLLNESGTGKVKVAENVEKGSIPREDVAKVLLEILDAANTYRKSFDLISGEKPIKEEIDKL
ncbi:SDR family oxidoreductase [Sutcliffiella rhizosphaerae]|uniref:Sugar epimerase YhfK n=1 Tax=Sutcliffiella rhizosphaerae TaxID=2880967 RepID=A0ABM8YJ83_9BACI|nr:SDR family oxidoreductase [Sutcliffiella rhizosphaerae]CAG9619950.1 putative sugar epimerase YhfK [Sutcliffiella rhizosphaerae]